MVAGMYDGYTVPNGLAHLIGYGTVAAIIWAIGCAARYVLSGT
jgi:hypothetical protein